MDHIEVRIYRNDFMIGANANRGRIGFAAGVLRGGKDPRGQLRRLGADGPDQEYAFADGDEYAIGVYNYDETRRADVRIVIDGKWIGLYRVPPAHESVIARPVASAHPFVYHATDSFGGGVRPRGACNVGGNERSDTTKLGHVEITVSMEDKHGAINEHAARYGPMMPTDDVDTDADGTRMQRFEPAERMPLELASVTWTCRFVAKEQ
jgi:hypothetical protein